MTLPFSIAAGNPACWSSPTIGPGLKLVVPAGHDDVVGRELPASGGGGGAGLQELLVEGERVPFRREEGGLVLNLFEEGLERLPLLGRALERVPDGGVGRHHDRSVAPTELAPHPLQGGSGDTADSDQGRHRPSQDLGREGLDPGDLLRGY